MSDQDTALIAYCGLYCGECFSHKGTIADLARDLRKELRQYRFDKTAESLSNFSFFAVFEHYPQCYEVLGAMVKFRCKKACKGGGGRPDCKIRKCCHRKGFDGCWECDDMGACTKLDVLIANHGDAHFKNLRKLKKKGVEEFLQGTKLWYSKPK